MYAGFSEHEGSKSDALLYAGLAAAHRTDGYAPIVSPLVGVPPDVTDLDLELTAIGNFYHPLVVR